MAPVGIELPLSIHESVFTLTSSPNVSKNQTHGELQHYRALVMNAQAYLHGFGSLPGLSRESNQAISVRINMLSSQVLLLYALCHTHISSAKMFSSHQGFSFLPKHRTAEGATACKPRHLTDFEYSWNPDSLFIFQEPEVNSRTLNRSPLRV